MNEIEFVNGRRVLHAGFDVEKFIEGEKDEKCRI